VTERSGQTCRLLFEQLSAYLDGDLPAPECQAIAKHARRCARCRTVIAELRHTMGLCRGAAVRPLPKPVRVRAQARIKRLLDARRTR
jgi:anti-sigma factor RsiW